MPSLSFIAELHMHFQTIFQGKIYPHNISDALENTVLQGGCMRCTELQCAGHVSWSLYTP